MNAPLQKVAPMGLSCYKNWKPSKIHFLKNSHYQVLRGIAIGGDAPKEFIRVYEPRLPGCRKANPRTWPLYIAKTAEKWYPTESITEHALNRLGQCLGLPMAHSRIVIAAGQVRFLSRYFLRRDREELVHGADILAGYLNNDMDFIREIEAQGQERELVSVQLFLEALRAAFPAQYDEISKCFVRMLLFDALVGNNDRHFYNYGVIRDLTGKSAPCFSPIYDTARGLLWNQQEQNLLALYPQTQQCRQFLQRYVRKSQPKLSWDGNPNITHFGLVEQLAATGTGLSRAEMHQFYKSGNLFACSRMLDLEFNGILSPQRIHLMKECLNMRLQQLLQITC